MGDSLQNKLICTVRVRRCEFASVAGSTAHKILQRVNNSHISRPNLNLGQQKYFSPIGKSVLCSRPCLHHHAGLSTLQVLKSVPSLNKHTVKSFSDRLLSASVAYTTSLLHSARTLLSVGTRGQFFALNTATDFPSQVNP